MLYFFLAAVQSQRPSVVTSVPSLLQVFGREGNNSPRLLSKSCRPQSPFVEAWGLLTWSDMKDPAGSQERQQRRSSQQPSLHTSAAKAVCQLGDAAQASPAAKHFRH